MDRVVVDIEGLSIGEVFERSVDRFGQNVFMVLPRDKSRDYYPCGLSLLFRDAKARVDEIVRLLVEGGYGVGHRIAVLLENRPEMLLAKLACNRLGISWVPLNPDYREAELAFVLRDSSAVLVLVTARKKEVVTAAVQSLHLTVPVVEWTDGLSELPPALMVAPSGGAVGAATEASLLYTSGTTGSPKGCIMSHEYELMMGVWYATRGGLLKMRCGEERVYNPLPLFHVNAGIIQFYGMMLTGNCMVIPERFSRSRWWREVRETGSTGCHYLGVVVPVLMNEPPSAQDRDHKLRCGLGAGVEPTLHAAFEERFGFPLVEVWGMTEMCRILAACHEPRQIDTRAMGRPQPTLEVRVVDEHDHDVAVGDSGEMLVRYSGDTPRKGAFSGYLNQPAATEHAWRGGWFHTGDTVRQDPSGMLYFVDRKKNIIRRSGENIAAAEIEAVLQALNDVSQVAVVPVPDELRDEEVLAAVVLNDRAIEGNAGVKVARRLFDACFARLAYYKAPGWIVFVDELPVTGTQKVLKHMIFGTGVDPRRLPRAHDFRSLKVRQ